MSPLRFITLALRVLLYERRKPVQHPWTPEKIERAARNAIRERERRGMLS